MKHRNQLQSGFTLVELMMVIVIIGILVAIALPNYIGSQNRAKVSSVKSNMHTLQTTIETYAVEWDGRYADTLAALNTEATQAGRQYWKDFVNPITGVSGLNATYRDLSVMPPANPANAGFTLYNPTVNGTRPITTYFVYGLDKNGSPILDRGQDFYLTNG